MNRFLFVFLAFVLSSNVNGLKLESLCQNSTFKYLGFTDVNSVHTIKFNRTLPRIGNYLYNETLSFSHLFRNNTYAKRMREYADGYNQVMVLFYSENFFFWCKVYDCEIVKLRQYIRKYQRSMESLRRRVKDRYRPEFYEHVNLMWKGRAYLRLIRRYFNETLQTRYFKLDEFKKIISELKINKSTETFSLESLPVSKIYEQPIKQFERFYFIRKSNSHLDFNSYGIVEMSLRLPFHQNNWKASQSACIQPEYYPYLPAFYKKNV